MESPGSSIISALGAGSGVDFIKLADDIAAASFAGQRNNLTTRRQSLEAQVSAAAQLRNALTSLASALGERIRNGDLAPRGVVANPAVATVSVAPGALPRGTFSLEVSALASAQTLVSAPLASSDALVGEGTFTLRLGTVDGTSFTPDAARDPITIAVSASDTLASLASKINQASGGAIAAYVASGTGGAQLVLKGREGAANGFVVEAAGMGGGPVPGDLEYLAWAPGASAPPLQSVARDAAFSLDGVAMTSPSNRVTGLPGGFTLTLGATNAGAPTTISFGGNSAALSAVMGDLVAALNDITAQVNELAAPLGGPLGNDNGARALRRSLAALAGEVVMPGASAGAPRTLGDLGLALNRDGTFRLDAARLSRALEDQPEAVAAMFTTGASGVFATIDRFVRANSSIGNPGTLGGSLTRYERELAASDARLGKIAEQQEALRLRLTREFTASERRVAAAQSTLAFLRQQVDLWSARER